VSKRERTILLDADILAYKVSVVNQKDYDFGDTGQARHIDEESAIKQADELVGEYCEAVGAKRAVICLSDPERNFRKELDPTYKANRAGLEDPVMRRWIESYLATEYVSFKRPRLEADDCMGILATKPGLLGSKFQNTEVIMVSEDKDMRTVPGKLYNPNRPELGVIDITEDEANRFHLWQTICGDPTDGYPGVKGVGPKSEYALYLMEDAESDELWDVVLEAFASKGQTEEQALLQARLAHILWASSFNLKSHKVRLWQPYWL
jgi:DNA polymerase-1